MRQFASEQANVSAAVGELPARCADDRHDGQRRSGSATLLGPTAEKLRPAARALRPGQRGGAPARARGDAAAARRHPPVRARGAPGRARPAAGRHATWPRPTPALTRSFERSTTSSTWLALQPERPRGPGQRRAPGGLPVLGRVGAAHGDRSCSRARTPTAPSARSRSARPAPRSSSCVKRASRELRVPLDADADPHRLPGLRRPADEQVRPLASQDPHDGRLRAVVLRPAAVPVAVVRRRRSRSSRRATACRSPSRRRPRWPPRPTCGSPASRSARCASSRSTATATARWPRSSSTASSRRCARTRARCCARRRCWARPTSS